MTSTLTSIEQTDHTTAMIIPFGLKNASMTPGQTVKEGSILNSMELAVYKQVVIKMPIGWCILS